MSTQAYVWDLHVCVLCFVFNPYKHLFCPCHGVGEGVQKDMHVSICVLFGTVFNVLSQ